MDDVEPSVAERLAAVGTPDLARELYRRAAPAIGLGKLLLEGENGQARFLDRNEVRIPVVALGRFDEGR